MLPKQFYRTIFADCSLISSLFSISRFIRHVKRLPNMQQFGVDQISNRHIVASKFSSRFLFTLSGIYDWTELFWNLVHNDFRPTELNVFPHNPELNGNP